MTASPRATTPGAKSPVAIHPIPAPGRDTEFLRLPWIVYRSHSRWVPPLLLSFKRLLDPKKNPFWKHADARFWVARRDGRAAGRIGAVVNRRHDEAWNERAGFFGFFECIEDYGVAEALLATARDWLEERGARVLRGPVSPSTNDECGVLVEGFDRDPFIMMPYTPAYYPEFLERFGLEKRMDLFAFAFSPFTDLPPKVDRVADLVQQRYGIRLRTLVMRDFAAEIERLRTVYNGAWADNWGFVPMSREEFAFAAEEFKSVAMPDFIMFAERDDRTVGAMICVPDLNPILKKMNGRLLPFKFRHLIGWRRKVEAIRLLTMGVLPEYRTRGVDALFYRGLLNRAREIGFTKASELGWVLESNDVMVNTILRVGGERTKRLRIYEMGL